MSDTPEEKRSPLQEMTQPFIDLMHAPRALWGINLAYVIEGMVYFGMLGYLAMYFNDYVALNDVWAGRMVGVLTAGITIAMFFLGAVADKKGVRFALIAAFLLMFVGRIGISMAPVVDPSQVRIEEKDAGRNDPVFLLTDAEPIPTPEEPAETEPGQSNVGENGEAAEGLTGEAPDMPTGEALEVEPQPAADAGSNLSPTAAETETAEPGGAEEEQEEEAPSPGLGSLAHILAMVGIFLVVVGYGMYQPGAYAAVRQFTTEKTAAMGFAMLYALMNLGGWIPTYAFLLRNNEFDVFSQSLPGAGFGRLGTIWVYTAFTAVALLATYFILSRRTIAKAVADAKAGREREKAAKQTNTKDTGSQEETAQQTGLETPQPESGTFLDKVGNWLKNHPLANAKFSFFIFCLIPVQTLFAHNWLTLPMYVERAYVESWPWISKNFEPAVNFNPLLIFIFVPIVTAITQKANVYKMMILGTFVMAAPTFLLAIGPHWWTLLAFLVIMTIGEAMWQPRFLQYAAEIAPEGRTGAYMGVAQLPWFLTKMVVPIYSGWFLQNYCPNGGPEHTQPMWIIYGCIAISSTVMLILAKGWIGKDFKTKAA